MRSSAEPQKDEPGTAKDRKIVPCVHDQPAPMTMPPPDKQTDPIDVATSAIDIMLEMLGGLEHLPASFWDDEFVLGFIFYSAYAYAIRAGAGDIAFKELRRVYTDLLGNDGNSIFSQSMICQAEESPKFGKGLEAATKFISATGGQSTYDDDEAVITAHERAREVMTSELMTSEAGDHELIFDQALFIYLFEGLFAAEIRRRFPEMAT